MKPLTYFRLALLFPFILWGICALIYYMLSRFELSEAWNLAMMPLAFYVIGILLWFLPYIVLAVGLWIWSRNRSTIALLRSALLAPVLMLILMVIEITAITLPTEGIADFLEGIGGSILMLGFFSLLFGYLCVGIAAGIYKLLQSRKLIKEKPLAELA